MITEKRRAYLKQWRIENKAKILKYYRKWIKKSDKKYYRNPEKRRVSQNNWRSKNKERINSYQRKYRIKNNEKIKKYYRQYNLTHSRKKLIWKKRQDYKNYSGVTRIGRKYELIAESLLVGSKSSPYNHDHYDIEWNGLKVDVKMRNKNKRGSYTFSRRSACIADLFMCFCVDKKIKYILLIPQEVYKDGMDIRDSSIKTKYLNYIYTQRTVVKK